MLTITEPWTYEPDGDFHNHPDGAAWVDITGPGEHASGRFIEVPKGPNTKAIAALISAAPDLLAALTKVLTEWDSIPANQPVPEEVNNDDTWSAVRAAIAKAEGRG